MASSFEPASRAIGRRSDVAAVCGAVQLACTLEVSAAKVGNVTPHHRFVDLACADLVHSGLAIGPVLARAGEQGVGATILEAVEATRLVAPGNPNLGIVLLLAPLARAALLGADVGDLRESARDVLALTDVADAREAFAADPFGGEPGRARPFGRS